SRPLADPFGRLRRSSLQPAQGDHAGQRQSARRAVDVSDRRQQQVRGDADCRRRHALRHRRAEPCVGDRWTHGEAAVALPAHAAARTEGLLRSRQSRLRDLRRSAVHGDARRAPGGARGEDRQGLVRRRDGDGEGRVRRHRRAAGRERKSDCRRRRRRVREPRLHRCVRSAERPAPVALLHDSGAGRSGQRHLAGRYLAARRRADVAHRHLRPALNLLYWGTGNPNPDWDGESRPGANLYTDSLLALDPDTGTLKWHFQYTPHDTHDWDANEVPVLADLTIGGRPRKDVMMANRNGFFYVNDRATGEFLLARPFVNTTWAKEIAPNGTPRVLPNSDPTDAGTITCPDW